MSSIFVNASVKNLINDDDVEHIIEQALSCNLEKDGEDVLNCDIS